MTSFVTDDTDEVSYTLLRCAATHELVRWNGPKGDPCWVCGAPGGTGASNSPDAPAARV